MSVQETSKQDVVEEIREWKACRHDLIEATNALRSMAIARGMAEKDARSSPEAPKHFLDGYLAGQGHLPAFRRKQEAPSKLEDPPF